MDLFMFLFLLTFQITVIALVAMVFNQTDLANKAISGLVKLSTKFISSINLFRERDQKEGEESG